MNFRSTRKSSCTEKISSSSTDTVTRMPPYILFGLFYESQYALDWASKVIFAGVPGMEIPLAPPQLEGSGGPGAVRAMGVTPARDFA